MFARQGLVICLIVSAAACLGPARLKRALPNAIGPVTAVQTIEIVDESGAVVLGGQFDPPEMRDGTTSRVATMNGADTSARGTATLETIETEDGPADSLALDVSGLAFPSLYRVRIDRVEVTVFTATTSGDTALQLVRSESR